jgi:hypothetical protein
MWSSCFIVYVVLSVLSLFSLVYLAVVIMNTVNINCGLWHHMKRKWNSMFHFHFCLYLFSVSSQLIYINVFCYAVLMILEVTPVTGADCRFWGEGCFESCPLCSQWRACVHTHTDYIGTEILALTITKHLYRKLECVVAKFGVKHLILVLAIANCGWSHSSHIFFFSYKIN